MKINLDTLSRFVDIEDDAISAGLKPGKIRAAHLKEVFAASGMEAGDMQASPAGQVIEIETTPNRPDWLGHCGVARDLHARFPQVRYSPLEVRPRSLKDRREDFRIDIENPSDCARYTACIVRDVRVGESPDDIKAFLTGMGMRPINSIVDISNVVLMVLGHPIHMFDLERIQDRTIRIRRGRSGETIRLLDGENVRLDGDLLVIADGRVPVALAGIMGGEESGVTGATTNILIESAYFDPVLIRSGARKLGLSTDASYRFERGMDIGITPTAIGMALDMLEDWTGQPPEITHYEDATPVPFVPTRIVMPKAYPSEYTGIDIPLGRSEQILRDLEFSVREDGDNYQIEVPTFRVDVDGKQDLVEEIIRIHGYGQLTSAIPRSANSLFTVNRKRQHLLRIGHHLNSLGCHEAVNYVFYSPAEHDLFASGETPIEIKNPLGQEFSVLKASLLPGLLKNLALNLNQGQAGAAFFEFGKHYRRTGETVEESEVLALAACGEYRTANWREKEARPFDFFVFKSLLGSLFQCLQVPFTLRPGHRDFYSETCSFSIDISGETIGHVGDLNPRVRDGFKLDTAVVAAEIFLNGLLKHLHEPTFKPWNRYPSSRRDFSFLIDRAIPYGDLEAEIDRVKPPELEARWLFDRYEGKNVPEGKVSLSMSFSYTHTERTLTTEEVNGLHDALRNHLITRYNLIPR